jgi:hypothetical protein
MTRGPYVNREPEYAEEGPKPLHFGRAPICWTPFHLRDIFCNDDPADLVHVKAERVVKGWEYTGYYMTDAQREELARKFKERRAAKKPPLAFEEEAKRRARSYRTKRLHSVTSQRHSPEVRERIAIMRREAMTDALAMLRDQVLTPDMKWFEATVQQGYRIELAKGKEEQLLRLECRLTEGHSTVAASNYRGLILSLQYMITSSELFKGTFRSELFTAATAAIVSVYAHSAGLERQTKVILQEVTDKLESISGLVKEQRRK